MKKLILMSAMVALSLCVFACSPEVSVDASCADFYESQHISKEVEVAVGDSFTVTLCSNASTGLRWTELAEIGDQTVVEQVDHKYVALSEEGKKPPPPGTPGEEVWTFNALKQGKSTISMEYGQPWESGEKAAWTFVLTVAVK